MGKRKTPYSKHNRKRQKAGFWITSCPESSRTNLGSHQGIIAITRVLLEDDYTQVPQKNLANQEPSILETTSEKGVTSTDEQANVSFEKSRSTVEDSDGDIAELQGLLEESRLKLSENRSQSSESVSFLVKRCKSAKIPNKKRYADDNFVPLPGGDCGDGVTNPHPESEVDNKYWSQRRRLFSRFDDGIQLDKESWYSVTPEAIATHISSKLVGEHTDTVVLDPFCGVGGNVIAFALNPNVKLVIGVDTDLSKLQMAAANAKVYNVPQGKLLLIHENACKVLSSYDNGCLLEDSKEQNTSPKADDSPETHYPIGGIGLLPPTIDRLFLSPPWGGMDYLHFARNDGYDLTNIQIDSGSSDNIDGEALFNLATKAIGSKPIAVFLPRNINGLALARCARKAGRSDILVMEQNFLNGKLKTVTTYHGLLEMQSIAK